MKVHMRDNVSQSYNGLLVPYALCEWLIAKGKATTTNRKLVTCKNCIRRLQIRKKGKK